MAESVGDHVSTRIEGQREVTVDGVPFEWWAVGDRPALVTVRTPLFGSLTELTTGDAAEFAVALARKILAQHHARAAAPKKSAGSKTATVPVLKKPGWFEPGSTDFTTTIY
jgi:hypothetical protein